MSRTAAVTALLVVLVAPAARAHIMMSYPPPRSNDDGLRNPPCGGIPPTEPTLLDAGATIEVRWRETIPHPGWFTIRLSDDGAETFAVLLDDLENPDLPRAHDHTQLVTLPNRNCDGCVLQLEQVMLDYDPVQSYFVCADITLVGGPDDGTPSDVGLADAGDADAVAEPGPDSSAETDSSEDDGGGCLVARSAPAPRAWWLLAMASVLAWARRRRATGRTTAAS